MNVTITRLSAVLLCAGAFSAGANAEYRCDSTPVGIDQRACAAAAQGPDALRRFVHRWDSQMSNLYFADYVDPKTQQAWDSKSRNLARQPTDDRVQVASAKR